MSRQAAFGHRLRRLRESRGISLRHIADRTKIGTRLLADLENGDCSRWPGGIYSRGFIRGYAAAVNLEADELLREFCECFPDVAWLEGTPTADPPADVPGSPSVRRRGLSHLRDLANGPDRLLDFFFRVEGSK